MEDYNTNKEVKLKNVKNVLRDLSIKFGYDIEPAKEIINVKHSHLNGISYPIFKECLFEWLEKQERILSTVIFADDTKLPLPYNNQNNERDNNKNSSLMNINEKEKKLDYDFGPDFDVNMIILHRSLYILKRKFELKESEIQAIYKKFMEPEKVEFVVDVNNFSELVECVIKEANFSFQEIGKPSDLFRLELVNKIKQDKVMKIIKSLNSFMVDFRRKYNNIMKDKKEKGIVDLVGGDYEELKKINKEIEKVNEGEIEKEKQSEIEKDKEKQSEIEKEGEKDNEFELLEKEKEKVKDEEEDNKSKTSDKKGAKDAKTPERKGAKDSKTTEKKGAKDAKSPKADKKSDKDTKNPKTPEKKGAKDAKTPEKKGAKDAKTPEKKGAKDAKTPEKKGAKDAKTPEKKGDKDAKSPKTDNKVKKDINDNSEEKEHSDNQDQIIEDKVDSENNPKEQIENASNNNNITLQQADEMRNLRKKLDDDVLSFVMDKSVLDSKIKEQEDQKDQKDQKDKDQELNFHQLDDPQNNEDKKLKYIIEKLKNRRIPINENTVRVQYLLIEILPLIFADYIHENPSIVILDTTEELKYELRTLFDNEILQRLGELIKYDIDEEKTQKLKDLLFEKLNIDKNIRVYEDLLIKKRSVRDNTVFIEQMLKKLKNQRIWIDNKVKAIQEDNETQNNYQQIQNSEPNMKSANTSHIQNDESMINKKNVSKIIPKKYLTKEELRSNALKEIFYFYSRQHHVSGLTKTFDDISNKIDHMDLGEFMKFCVEFKVLVKKDRLVEVFKKTAGNIRHMTYEEFLISLRAISAKVNEEKREVLLKRINRMRGQLKKFEGKEVKVTMFSPRNNEKSGGEKSDGAGSGDEFDGIIDKIDNNNPDEQNKEKSENENKQLEGNDNEIPEIPSNDVQSNEDENKNANKSNENNNPDERLSKIKPSGQSKKLSLVYNSPKEIHDEILNLKTILGDLKNKTYQQLLEDLFSYLEIDDLKQYRSKMKGFRLAFNSHDKNFRIPNDILMKNAKKIDARTAAEIKRILKERKQEKEKLRIEMEKEENLKYYNQRKKLTEINQKINNENKRAAEEKEDGYATLKQRQEIYEKEKEMKLTWDQLENLNVNYFNMNRTDDFNPTELFGIEEHDSFEENLFDGDGGIDVLNKSGSSGGTNKGKGNNRSRSNSPKNYSNIYSGRSGSNSNSKSGSYSSSNKSIVGKNYATKGAKNRYYEDKKNSSPVSYKKGGVIGNTGGSSYIAAKHHEDKTQKKMKEVEKEWEKKQIKVRFY